MTVRTTRMLKVSCEKSGYIARVSNKWIEERGAPICPCCKSPLVLTDAAKATDNRKDNRFKNFVRQEGDNDGK